MLPHPGDQTPSLAGAAPPAARTAGRLGRTFFAWGWIVIQVGVPTVLLTVGGRPAPFGWQMYSGSHPLPVVTLEVAGRAPVPVDMQPYVPRPRGDLIYADLIPPFLCEQVPGATAVRIQVPGSPTPQRLPCP